jgi:PKD repeat protein
VIVLMMENFSYRGVVGNSNAPFQTNLANQCGNATSFFSATHSSAANYMATSAGQYPASSPPGCGSAAACADPSDNLFSQLNRAGSSWGGYMESMPSPCYPKGAIPYTQSHTLYVVGHNPAVFYTGIPAANCQAHDVGIADLTAQSGTFWNDLQNQTLPAFSFVTPNAADNNEGAGTRVQAQQAGDTFLQKFVANLQQSNSYQAGNTLLLVTYDEGSPGGDSLVGEDCTNMSLDLPVTNGVSAHQDSCHIPTFVVYPYTPAGSADSTFFDHYSITKTVEQMFGLPYLAHAADAQTSSLVGHFGITAGVTASTPPTVSITNPTANSMVSGPLPASGTTAAGSAPVTEVDVDVDGGSPQTATGSATWSRSIDTTTLSNGPHTINVRAIDGNGKSGTASVNVVVSNIPANKPPVAAAVGECTQLDCAFDGSSSADPDGAVASYQWDFGDGHSGPGASPTHSYDAAGTYNYSLIVTDDKGLTSTAFQGSVVATDPVPPAVHVGAPLGGSTLSGTATISGTAAAGTAGVTEVAVAVDDATLQPAFGTSDWTLDLDTTQLSDGPHTIHVRATDGYGLHSSDSVDVTVSNGSPPPPDLPPTASATGSCTGLTCAFDGGGSSDPDGSVASYAWDFGDGATSTQPTPRHKYASAGDYGYTLTVTDNRGVDSTVFHDTVSPSDAPPVAVGSSSCNGLNCTFDASASSDADGSVASYAWDFGDGTTSTDAHPSHHYAHAATYHYTLVVTDDQGVTSNPFGATASPVDLAPVASATASCTKLTCSFDASASSDADGSVASYAWDFGDGSTGTGAQPTHKYGAGGTDTYTLTVTDDQGMTSDVARGTVTPVDAPPVAVPTATCTNLTCSFSGSGSSDPDGSVASYAWSFGDGTTAVGVSPSHTYAAAGSYTYSLTVTDDQGVASVPATRVATPSQPSVPVAFRAAAHSYVKAATVATGAAVTAPAAVRAGDTELLFVSSTIVGATGSPTGWTLVGQQTSSPLQVMAFRRTALATDANAKVTVPVLAPTGVGLQIAAYSGVGTPVTLVGASDSATATHVTPSGTVTAAGSWVTSFWADKSSTTTAWNLPTALRSRDTVIGTGGGHPSAAIADSGQSVVPGTSPKRTATVVGGASGKGAMLTVVLRPQS